MSNIPVNNSIKTSINPIYHTHHHPWNWRTGFRWFSPTVRFQGEFEVPKMLIFAKTDSHAEDIMEVVREEFNEMISVKDYIPEQGRPKTILSQFRNDYYPRIAVTVNMIATGTDIRPGSAALYARCEKPQLLWTDEGARYAPALLKKNWGRRGTPTPNSLKTILWLLMPSGGTVSKDG